MLALYALDLQYSLLVSFTSYAEGKYLPQAYVIADDQGLSGIG